jgi:hypothetical protein
MADATLTKFDKITESNQILEANKIECEKEKVEMRVETKKLNDQM